MNAKHNVPTILQYVETANSLIAGVIAGAVLAILYKKFE